MKLAAHGQIDRRITALATASYPAYVVQGDTASLMVDSGINHLAPLYLSALTEHFGDPRRLDYLFLTHSHYDHAGSAGYLKRHLPGLKIAAHERVVALAQKQSVVDTMNRLSSSHTELLRYNPSGEDVTLHPFVVDLPLKQGDELDLGGLTCQVHEVPGHTRDSVALYVPEIGALFPGDASGVLREDGEWLQVAFVASYDDYVESLHRLIALRPALICLAHNWVLTGDDATAHLQRSLELAVEYRKKIERHLDMAAGSVEVAAQTILVEEREADGGLFEPSAGYLTNLAAQVRLIAGMRAG